MVAMLALSSLRSFIFYFGRKIHILLTEKARAALIPATKGLIAGEKSEPKRLMAKENPPK
ncbi:hypothetical protein CRD_02015 [Raphidiopsis brookii D9]|nr:hypothetical protein CRD_02015 [Raphidiopsis brookii D9]